MAAFLAVVGVIFILWAAPAKDAQLDKRIDALEARVAKCEASSKVDTSR